MNRPDSTTFDLSDRTLDFAQAVRLFFRRLPRTVWNREDGRQLLRASGRVGASYIAAKAATARKEIVANLRLARKEAKESRYWLRLLDAGSDLKMEQERVELIHQAGELARLLRVVVQRVQPQPPA
jgi:four helix bundle protein